MSERDLRRLLRPELASLHAYETPADPAPIRLDANESPWPMPEEARARIASALSSLPLHRYPDPRAGALRDALARYAGAEPGELVIGAGSDELIAILETALAQPRADRARASVLHPDPSFSMYGIIARGRGLDAIKVPLDARFQLDVPAMRSAIEEHRPSLVFLASPNNPTGNAFEESAIRAVIEAAHDALVIVDEAYVEFAERSLRGLFAEHENVAVMGTLSKIGLAALRVGWVRVRPWLAHELEKLRMPYNMPLPSQEIATLALGELMPVIREQIQAIRDERSRLIEGLRAIPGLSPCPTDANFVLVHVGAPGPEVVCDAVKRAGIQLRSFAGHPRLGSHVRITVGTPEENDAVLAALGHAVGR